MGFIKKILYLILIISPIQEIFAETWFSKNKTYSSEVTFRGKKFNLPDGNWKMVSKWDWHIVGIQANGVTLAQIENNTLKAMIDFSELTSPGKKPGLVAEFLHTSLIKNKYDGCYEKNEYYFVKLWKKGGSFNCLRLRHIDLKKETYNPDYNALATGYSEYYRYGFKKFVNDNNLLLPKILIQQRHMFYSQLTGGRAQLVTIDKNPEFLGVGPTLIGTEENSEYHKDNLSKYPTKEKLVKSILKESFIYHENFEEILGVRKHQKLYLNTGAKIKMKNDNSSLANQLEKINKLYKSGALTKEEFETAKKKLLQ